MKSGAKDVVLAIWFDLRDAICGTGVFGEELVAHHSLGNRVAIFEIKFVESDVREIAAPSWIVNGKLPAMAGRIYS